MCNSENIQVDTSRNEISADDDVGTRKRERKLSTSVEVEPEAKSVSPCRDHVNLIVVVQDEVPSDSKVLQ